MYQINRFVFALFLVFEFTNSNVVSQSNALPVLHNEKSTSVPALSIDIQTVDIPAGTFKMGSPITEINRFPEETQYKVTLSAFRMSKCEITNAQYAAFLNSKNIGGDGLYAAGAYPTQVLIYASSGKVDWGLHYISDKWIPAPGYDNYPVVNVTWYGAMEFATFVGGTLPTEAQWEYACRAGSKTPFNTGRYLGYSQANYDWTHPYNSDVYSTIKSPGKTQVVGTYRANDFGLYDMHGNVWEWCSDWYGQYPKNAQINPKGPTEGMFHVFRGGSWNNYAYFCRSAYRRSNEPTYKYVILGFRIVFNP